MKRFKKVYIEITNICNLQCKFCPKTKRKLSFMKTESFENILINIKPFTDHIYLHVLGEPLLHPELKNILDLCSFYHIKVNITTNGTLIEKNTELLLASEAIRQVNFSLHSFEANEFEVPLENYVQDILNFIHTTSMKTKIICSMRLWNMQSEGFSSSDQKESNKNSDIYKLIEKSFNLDFNLEEVLQTQNSLKISDQVYLNMAKRFQWPNMNSAFLGESGFCQGLRDQIGILVDGTVIPCCLDGEGVISLGNIFSNSFSSIINADRTRSMYEGFSNRIIVEELCKRCGFKERFNK